MTPEDISEHNCFAYSNSVKEYDSKGSNSKVVRELVQFMDLMPYDGLVLDLGAGHLRDTLYMVNPGVRDFLKREGMGDSDLSKRLNVIPLEKSAEFLNSCVRKLDGDWGRIPLVINGDFMTPGKASVCYSRDWELEEVFTEGNLYPVLDGIWSCAAYMVHMAPGKLGEATKGWADTLKKDGIFAISYINKRKGGAGMRLFASKSAPGEVKIFSHYDRDEVDAAFEGAGMSAINSSTGDYDGHGHVEDKFFTSVMYRKG